MDETKPPIITNVDGPVATITLSRPDALNAITRQMLDELSAALERVEAIDEVRVVILTGAGRAFSAGVDLKDLGLRSLDGGTVGDVLDVPAREVIRRMTTMDKLVIGRVNGFCFTGALELALACDLVIVASEAQLGDTHAKWGLRPTWGMSQRLIRAVGVSRARYLSYSSATFTGSEAAEWGLALQAVPLASLDDAVATVTASVIANSAGSLAAYKDLYRAALDSTLEEGLAYEARTTYPIDDTEDRVSAFR